MFYFLGLCVLSRGNFQIRVRPSIVCRAVLPHVVHSGGWKVRFKLSFVNYSQSNETFSRLNSATSLTNAVVTVIHDRFTRLDKRWITTAVCIIGFFSGLIYVTPGGQWMLELVSFLTILYYNFKNYLT